MRELIAIRMKAEAQDPVSRQFFELEGSSLTGAVVAFGEEDGRDYHRLGVHPGVYVLQSGINPEGKPIVYIGAAEQLGRRIANHKSQRRWERSILLASSDWDLTKDHFLAVEATLISLADQSTELETENIAKPKRRVLAPRDNRAVDRYVEDGVKCLRFFGLNLKEFYPATHETASFGLDMHHYLEQMDDLEVLARISATLGIRIHRIVWYHGEPNTMVYVTDKGIIEVHSPWRLASLRKACRSLTGHEIPPLRKDVWEATCRAIAWVAVVYNMTLHRLRRSINPEVLIAAYLAINSATQVSGPVGGIEKPFIKNRRIHLYRTQFEAWHRRFRQRKAKSADILAGLLARGWLETTEDILVDGEVRPFKLWVSPFKWRPDVSHYPINIP